MLRLKDVSKTIGPRELLKKANFKLGDGQKVALIGPNGSGKTTLIKLVLGEDAPDSGQILVQNERIGYLPQEISFPAMQTVGAFFATLVPSKAEFWRVEKILAHLGMIDIRHSQKTNSLSEGQKMKIKLVETLINEPTLLLLDEPTNHLDLAGIRWFENFVQNFAGSVLTISHDRSFLDNTTDTILEVDEKTLISFPGNYTDYKRQKEGWIEKRERVFKKQEKKRAQLEELIENVRRIKDGKQRGRAIRAAKKRMEREILAQEVSAYTRHGVTDLTIAGAMYPQKLVLSVEGLSKQFGTKEVFRDLDFEIRGHQRVWLQGSNGAGKSTLLNLITQKTPPSAGSARIGVNTKWGYFQQNQAHLPKDLPVGAYIEQQLGLAELRQFQFLTKFGFPATFLNQRLGRLSPGERARLSFGIFTQEEYNFLILDEPTNHLDIWTKEKIEESLQQFRGAILLVSHDRYFIENVGVDRILNIDEGRLVPV